MQIDGGTHSIQMRGEMSQIFFICDVVYLPSRKLQSGVDMSWSNEYIFSGNQAGISKYG
jgi:hypothetical protein